MRSHTFAMLSASRLHRLIGYLVIVIALFITTKAPSTQRNNTDTEIVIVKAQQMTRINPYQEEYERMLYPTVRITAGYSTGTGVVINHKGTKDTKNIIYILTACHVVENENTVDIELYDSSVITASVVITDTANDLALLCALSDLCGESIYSAKLAGKDYQYFLFTPVYAVGCSLGLSPRPSSGILSALSDSVVEITAPILPGNSGGPVYDARTYEVIGIAVWVKTYQGQLVTTMAGIVPINQIYEFINHKE
ncbi:MAG TPA: serine protease [Planctomycetota bacterium]|nr:serine protease [Planctomycetota bacterium]